MQSRQRILGADFTDCCWGLWISRSNCVIGSGTDSSYPLQLLRPMRFSPNAERCTNQSVPSAPFSAAASAVRLLCSKSDNGFWVRISRIVVGVWWMARSSLVIGSGTDSSYPLQLSRPMRFSPNAERCTNQSVPSAPFSAAASAVRLLCSKPDNGFWVRIARIVVGVWWMARSSLVIGSGTDYPYPLQLLRPMRFSANAKRCTNQSVPSAPFCAAASAVRLLCSKPDNGFWVRISRIVVGVWWMARSSLVIGSGTDYPYPLQLSRTIGFPPGAKRCTNQSVSSAPQIRCHVFSPPNCALDSSSFLF